MASHPPPPRLTLRVGITGHRPNKLRGEAAARIARQLPLVLGAIERAAENILAAHPDVYARQAPELRLISGFAEGADQMAVAACPETWRIEAILPFPVDEYLEDFVQSAAGDGRDVRAELEESLKRAAVVTAIALPRAAPAAGGRNRGYVAAGSYLLRQIDVLVAVWDGRPPETGGTGAIAKNAFDGGIPVVWLSTLEDRPPRLLEAFEADGDPVAPEPDCTGGPLAAVLHALLAPPAEATRSTRRSARAALADFYRETWRSRTYCPFYDLLVRLAAGQWPRLVIRSPPFQQMIRRWDSFLAAAPESGDLSRRLQQVLLPRHVWSDALAVHFSHLYRSAYVLAYLLSAVAVFIALGGLLVESVDHKAVLVGCELLVIGVIIVMILIGRRRRWHERWLDYRGLAEALRNGRYLAYVSEFGRVQDHSPSGHQNSWVAWYLRATMREIGLPTAILDATYRWRILNATLQHEPREQMVYHDGNSRSTSRIDHLLHGLGILCFSATFAVLALFLIIYGSELLLAKAAPTSWLTGLLGSTLLWLKKGIILVSAGLPALGAALAGIRVHGDFEGSSERSEHMLNALASLERDYRSTMDGEMTLEDTAELLIATARIMSQDVGAWQDLYGRKRLTLPA